MYNFLVVDDERLLCNGMRQTLEALGYFKLFVAYGGKQALEILRAQPIDAMLLDIAMPGIDGIQVMHELCEDEHKPVTVIASGYDAFAYAKQALRYGAIDYVLKPIDSDDVTKLGQRMYAILQQTQSKQSHLAQLRKFVLENTDVIKQKLLHDILETRQSSLDVQDLYDIYGIDLRGSHFCVAVVRVSKQEEGVGEVDFQVALKLVQECIEKQIADLPGANLFHMENAKYVLIVSANSPLGLGGLSGRLKAIMEMVSSVAFVECCIGKGGEVRGVDNIATSYRSAHDALVYRAMFGTGEIYDINDFRISGHAQVLGQIAREMKGALKLGKQDLAKAKMEAYFAYLEQHKARILPGQMKFFAANCIMAFMTVQVESEPETDLQWDALPFSTKLFWLDTLPQLKNKAVALLDNAFACLPRGQQERQKMVAASIRAYIQEHYADNGLSVLGISKDLNYSPNYIGNVFKKEYALLINDYINTVRIEHAKRMIEQTNLKLFEIALTVGFGDQHYFSKTFKKYQGVTPKEYRANR